MFNAERMGLLGPRPVPIEILSALTSLCSRPKADSRNLGADGDECHQFSTRLACRATHCACLARPARAAARRRQHSAPIEPGDSMGGRDRGFQIGTMSTSSLHRAMPANPHHKHDTTAPNTLLNPPGLSATRALVKCTCCFASFSASTSRASLTVSRHRIHHPMDVVGCVSVPLAWQTGLPGPRSAPRPQFRPAPCTRSSLLLPPITKGAQRQMESSGQAGQAPGAPTR